ncbi:MAG: hypothetical protein LM590_05085 [Thermofilum sp.]|nr:hypothetical protein [Thermofilum sp.]
MQALPPEEAYCDESGWCDLSEDHKSLREQLEEYIRKYIEGVPHLVGEGGWEEWRTPILVAPYGSGKTTLMRYLFRYCWRQLKVPALLVNLSEIVEFARQQGLRGKVLEDKLPGIIKEFFELKLNEIKISIERNKKLPDEFVPPGKKLEEYLLPASELVNIIEKYNAGGTGVLFIDEVEEAYKDLTAIISYETSPFRGLADKIKDRASSVFTILAFGPSAALREVSSGPAAWRMVRFDIPFLSKENIKRILEQQLEIKDYLDLLSNTVWWFSRGRIAWVYKLINEKVPSNIVNCLSGNKIDSLKDVLTSDALSATQIIEGVPLLDGHELQQLLRSTTNKGYAKLLLITSALVGPIPVDQLKKWGIDENILSFAPRSWFVVGQAFCSVEGLTAAIVEKLKARLEKEGLKEEAVKRAESLARKVLGAWSLEGKLLYDLEALKSLKDLAADYAYDVYRDEPQIGEALRELRLEALNISTETAGTLHVALSPTCIKTIFPPAVLVPTFGAAKEVRVKELYDEVDKLLDDLDEMNKYSTKIKNILNLSELKESLMFVYPSKAREKEIRRAVLEYFKKTKERIIVLLVGPERNSEELMKELSKSMLFKTIAYAAPLTERAALYLASLLYNLAHEESYVEELARGGEKVDKLDRRVFEWYNYLLRVQINEAQRKMRDRDKILNENILKLIESVHEAKGREIGSQQAYLFYLNAAFPENNNYLIEVIKRLENVRESYEKLINIMSREIYPEGLDVNKILDEELFSDLRLLCTSGEKFLNRVTKLNNEIAKIESLFNLISEINYLMPSYDTVVDSKRFIENIVQTARLIKEIILKSSEYVSEIIIEDLAYILISHILKGRDLIVQPTVRNEIPIKMKSFIINFINPTIVVLDKMEISFKNLGIDITSRTNQIRSALHSLMDNINSLREIAQIEEEIGMKVREYLLRLSLVDGIKFEERRQVRGTKGFLNVFVENIFNYDKYIRLLKEKIEDIEKSLEDLENAIKEVKDQLRLLEFTNITYDELMESIKYDLSLVSNMRMYEMNQYIRNISEIIKEMVTKLKSFKEETLKYSDPRMESLISKILSDVYGG